MGSVVDALVMALDADVADAEGWVLAWVSEGVDEQAEMGSGMHAC